MKCMKYRVVLLSLMSLLVMQVVSASPSPDVEKPYVKTLVVKTSKDGSRLAVDVTMRKNGEWLGWFDYIVIRVPKKEGTLVSAAVTDTSLSTCDILFVSQFKEGYFADVMVSFEAENDGGFNSCDVTLKNKNGSRVVELGAEVGE